MRYDGKVNLPYRQYSVTDHSSTTVPYFGGLDSDIKKDKYQDWVLNQAGSYSLCPGYPLKCTFVCSIARQFDTGWQDDYNMEA